jgi:hypothetical protein
MSRRIQVHDLPFTCWKIMYGAILLTAASLAPLAQAQAERYEALANSTMVENRPTPETSALLKDELLFQRAQHQ